MKRLGLALVAAMLVLAQPAASDEGRYTIHNVTITGTTDSAGNLPRGTLLLDTRTGQTWLLLFGVDSVWRETFFAPPLKGAMVTPPVGDEDAREAITLPFIGETITLPSGAVIKRLE